MIVGLTIPQAGVQDEIKRKVRGALAFNAFCFWKAEGIDQLPPILVTIPSPSSKITEPKVSLSLVAPCQTVCFSSEGSIKTCFINYGIWVKGLISQMSSVHSKIFLSFTILFLCYRTPLSRSACLLFLPQLQCSNEVLKKILDSLEGI